MLKRACLDTGCSTVLKSEYSMHLTKRMLQDDYRGTKRKKSQSSYDYLSNRKTNYAYYNSDSNPWELDNKSIIFLLAPLAIVIIIVITCWRRGCRILGCEMECCRACCLKMKRRPGPGEKGSPRLRKSLTIQIEEYYINHPEVIRTDFTATKSEPKQPDRGHPQACDDTLDATN